MTILAYATYILHLILTSNAKTMRVFLLLMLRLILLICANFVGCAKMDMARTPFQN